MAQDRTHDTISKEKYGPDIYVKIHHIPNLKNKHIGTVKLRINTSKS